MIKDIPGYEGLYVVIDDGRIYSLRRNKFLKMGSNGQVELSKNNKQKGVRVHRIVAEAFHPNYREDWDVHHIDHNPKNNNIDNLMCLSKEEHRKLHSESEITKRKRSKAMEGNKNCLGRVLSEETKRKISEGNKGENNPHYGKHHSEEHKQKIINSMKKKAVVKLNEITKEFIEEIVSIREASRREGINSGRITECCRGKRESAGGYCWMYAEDYYKEE